MATTWANSDSLNVSFGTRTKGTSTVGIGKTAPVEILTIATTLTEDDSGKTFFLNSTTEFAVTLPVPQIGLCYSFIVKAAPSGASYTVVTNASAQVLGGRVICSADAAGDTENDITGTTITFADGQAVVGDRADIISDGAGWYAICYAAVAAGITITG